MPPYTEPDRDRSWPLWRVRVTYLWSIAKRVFWQGDTTAIRTLMGAGSLFFAIGLWPTLNTFSRPVWGGMAQLAPAWVWGIAFALHAVGVGWRFVDPVARGNWAFVVHAFGVALWALYVGLTTMFVGEYTPSTAMETAVLISAFVSLFRIGLNEEVLTP